MLYGDIYVNVQMVTYVWMWMYNMHLFMYVCVCGCDSLLSDTPFPLSKQDMWHCLIGRFILNALERSIIVKK